MPTIHIIDWLGSPNHRAIGISLMRKAHDGPATQFGLGVARQHLSWENELAMSYGSVVPVYTRVLRAGYWLRTTGLKSSQRCLRLARDTIQSWTQPLAKPQTAFSVQRVSSFGPEVDPIVEQAKTYAIFYAPPSCPAQ